VKQDLEQLLEREIRIANDANCFTLSEAIDGAAQGAPVVFGVIVGTGVGGGIVVNGQLLEGTQHIAGEWGHNVLEPDGPPAIAASEAVSRHSCPARDWRVTTTQPEAIRHTMHARLPSTLRKGMRSPKRRCSATWIASDVRCR